MNRSEDQFPISHVKPVSVEEAYGWDPEEAKDNMGVKLDSNYQPDHERNNNHYKKMRAADKVNSKARAEGTVGVAKIRSNG